MVSQIMACLHSGWPTAVQFVAVMTTVDAPLCPRPQAEREPRLTTSRWHIWRSTSASICLLRCGIKLCLPLVAKSVCYDARILFECQHKGSNTNCWQRQSTVETGMHIFTHLKSFAVAPWAMQQLTLSIPVSKHLQQYSTCFLTCLARSKYNRSCCLAQGQFVFVSVCYSTAPVRKTDSKAAAA